MFISLIEAKNFTSSFWVLCLYSKVCLTWKRETVISLQILNYTSIYAVLSLKLFNLVYFFHNLCRYIDISHNWVKETQILLTLSYI